MNKSQHAKNTATADALKILDRRIPSTPVMERLMEIERINTEVGQKIYDMRKKAGLTQKQLAEKIGTTQSVISELEDADYSGNSVEMLTSVFHALGGRLKFKVETAPRRKLQPA
jgi:ribosome-binding protein aMBF1 (putative translation factor)